MRLAALDIGSNTVHVLVADVVRGRLEDVAHYAEMPELGPRAAPTGAIGTRAGIAMRAVRKVLGHARAHGYDELIACAMPAPSLSDPPQPRERGGLRRGAFGELPQAPEGEFERFAAPGGTAPNLPAVVARRRPPPVLTTADLLTCETRLDGRPARHVAATVGLPANRVKAMRAGVEALLLLLDWYGLAILHVSHEGLRHGMLLAYLERGADWWRDG